MTRIGATFVIIGTCVFSSAIDATSRLAAIAWRLDAGGRSDPPSVQGRDARCDLVPCLNPLQTVVVVMVASIVRSDCIDCEEVARMIRTNRTTRTTGGEGQIRTAPTTGTTGTNRCSFV